MQRTHIYLPESLTRQIDLIARLEKKSKAEVMRTALEAGMKIVPRKFSSTQALLKMAIKARSISGTGPHDLSSNHDYYTWGGPKKPLE